jgi:hypothetical protein
MSEFANHLKNRGHKMTEIERMMLEAAKRINRGEKSNSKKHKEIQEENNTKTLYMHWKYHPCDISKTAIRKAYEKILMGIDGFDEMTVYFLRPQNMQYLLTHNSILQGKDKGNISSNISTELGETEH